MIANWLDIIGKILPALTAAGGYFARMFQAENRKRRMRRQLYREVSRNCHSVVMRIALCTSLSGLRQGAPLKFTDKLDLSFGVWNFYSDEKRKELLFELNETEALHRIYDRFSLIVADAPGYAIVRGREAVAEVDERLLDGTLDKKLYERVSSADAWNFMNELLTGKRESYRKSLNPI